MNTAHHTVGKLCTMQLVWFHTTFLFDGVIEFLKFLRGQRRQRSVAEIRFDLIFNHRFVRIQRALANCEDHIFIDPSVEPFAERHFRILGEVGVAVHRDAVVELFGQLLLCSGKHIAVNRIAVLFVTDNDAAFPSSVFALAHHTVSRRSSLCHSITSQPNTQYHIHGGISS